MSEHLRDLLDEHGLARSVRADEHGHDLALGAALQDEGEPAAEVARRVHVAGADHVLEVPVERVVLERLLAQQRLAQRDGQTDERVDDDHSASDVCVVHARLLAQLVEIARRVESEANLGARAVMHPDRGNNEQGKQKQ